MNYSIKTLICVMALRFTVGGQLRKLRHLSVPSSKRDGLVVLADPVDSRDRRREGRSAAASSGCHGEGGGEVRGETAIVSKAKETELSFSRWH